ncbi:hypothetical protein [Limnoraphis robusta]|uniref:CopG family transcriptional regulator n=1 Tax=Limnoraphis robusta CS-951 TaxID=1637645 RepID=A0A0F5YK74_9CYAN|nr:hypothetical protein [Limnoraphis robusta]KKD39291.1 hypothetical protein WN50_04200 [Limnoraphis robusta CS-951]
MARKLANIQQQTEQDVLEVIQSSIEIHYQQLQQQADPLAKLKQSPFVGCFQAEPDLAEKSVITIHPELDADILEGLELI